MSNEPETQKVTVRHVPLDVLIFRMGHVAGHVNYIKRTSKDPGKDLLLFIKHLKAIEDLKCQTHPKP